MAHLEVDVRLVRWSSTFGARGAGGALRGGGGQGAGGVLRSPGAVLLLSSRPAHGNVNTMREEKRVFQQDGSDAATLFYDFRQH